MLSTLLALDADLLIWIHTHLHNAFLDWLIPLLRSKWTWLPLYVFLAAFVLINYGKRGGLWILFFVFAIIVSDTISTRLIKDQVERLRPCHTQGVVEHLHMLVSCGGQYGFCSSHAANHFTMAAFIVFTLGRSFRKIRWPLWIWAALIAFAQVYVGVHYPLDVVVGAGLGLLIGWVIAWYYRRISMDWSVLAA